MEAIQAAPVALPDEAEVEPSPGCACLLAAGATRMSPLRECSSALLHALQLFARRG